jgi:hypothetical protein
MRRSRPIRSGPKRGKHGSVRPGWLQGLGNTDGPIMAAMSRTWRAWERMPRRSSAPRTQALPLPRLSALVAAPPLPCPAGVEVPA